MSQVNANPNGVDDSNGRGAAANNLTWAVAMILVIAAIAIAVVYVGHTAHLF